MSSILDALRKRDPSRPEMRPLGSGGQGPEPPYFRRRRPKIFWLVVVLLGIGVLGVYGLNHIRQNSISEEVSDPVETLVQKEIIPDHQELVQVPTQKALEVPEPTIPSTPVPVVEKPMIVQKPVVVATPVKVEKTPEKRPLQQISAPPSQPKKELEEAVSERGISISEDLPAKVEDVRDSGITIQGEEEFQGRMNTPPKNLSSEGVEISEEQIQILPVESKSKGFKLNGIMYDDKKPLAIINGRLVGVGDRIQGHRVLAIEQNSVRLEDYESLLKLSE